MRPVFHALGVLVVLLSLNACQTTTSKQQPNVGPFDSHGRYVEAWADDPSKWRPYTPKDVEGDPPKIAKNEQPLDNSVPLATNQSPTTQVTPIRSGANSTRPPARNSTSKTKAEAERTAAKTTSKAKTGSTQTAKKSTKSKADSEPTAKKSTKSKADTEPTAKKSTNSKTSTGTGTKSKSSGTRHTVKPGDSLYTIAAKYGTTVSALRAANGISGNTIRDGKTLVIPARK